MPELLGFGTVTHWLVAFASRRCLRNEQNGEIAEKSDLELRALLSYMAVHWLMLSESVAYVHVATAWNGIKRAIITGATGFVGANLARRLVRDGQKTHLLVRHGYGPWRIETTLGDVYLHEVDLGDEEALVRVVGNISPDWCFTSLRAVPIHGKLTSARWCKRISS